MAREPQDRDEAKRSKLPGDVGGIPPAGDRSRRRDANDEAPRLHSSAQDDANEEWILVDDDLIAAAAEAEAAKRANPDDVSATQMVRRQEEGKQLVNEMQQAANDFGSVMQFGDRSEAAEAAEPAEADAEPAADASDEAAALAPVEAQQESGVEGGEALVPALETPAGEEPALAPEPEAEAPPPPQKRAPKSAPRPRRSMAAAATLLIAAALGAGGWYAWKNYGSRLWPSTDVASAPTTVDAPVAKPVAKPSPKKPDPVKPQPPTPAGGTSTKAPAPADPKSGTANGGSIPVIPVNPTSDPTSTAGSKLPTSASTAKPASSKSPAPIVNTTNAIRPAKPLGTAAAKSSSAVKKTDTIIELKNGHTLRGTIKRVKDDQITLGVQGGEYTFALSDVKVLESSAPEYRTDSEMPAVSIVLKSGQRMRGKLLKTSAERVTIVVEHGEMVIDRDQIREVSFTGRIHF